MTVTSTDRIEKKVLLRAPLARVWKALADSEAFGRWFGVKFEGPFAPGARVQGRITHEAYRDLPFEMTIETMEEERLFSWRWHPGAVDATVDYSSEPSTLVVFELEEVEGGTQLSVVESGFDRIPLARRAEAYRGNDEGWSAQMEAIKGYVDAAA